MTESVLGVRGVIKVGHLLPGSRYAGKNSLDQLDARISAELSRMRNVDSAAIVHRYRWPFPSESGAEPVEPCPTLVSHRCVDGTRVEEFA